MSEYVTSDAQGPLPPPPASDLAAASRGRRRRWPWVVAGLVALPIVELVLLILLGRSIGLWWTVGLLIAEAALGAFLMRLEGMRAWKAIRDASTAGILPTGELARAAVIFAGGILFILPGLLTDVLGLLCLIPGTQTLMQRLLLRAFGIDPRAERGALQRHVPTGAGATIPGEVVEGDLVGEDGVHVLRAVER